MTSSDNERAVHVALRLRPSDERDFAELAGIDTAEATKVLRRMQAEGLLWVDDLGRLTYPSPAETTALLVRQRLGHHLARTHALMVQLMPLTDALPANLRIVGGEEFTDDAFEVEVFSGGQKASIEALSRITEHGLDDSTEADLTGLLPYVDTAWLESEDRLQHWEILMAGSERSRVLMPPPPESMPLSLLEPHMSLGMHFRTVPNPPSWMWAERHSGQVALPLTWGSRNPTTIVVLRHPAVTAMATALFEALWDRSSPIRPDPESSSWNSLLRFMRAGLTLEESSQRLGITSRTARRRLDEGMRHYGVETIFGLGAAWAADLEGVVMPGSRDAES